MPAIAERLASYLNAHHIAYEALWSGGDASGLPRGGDSEQAVCVRAWVLVAGERYMLLVLPAGQAPAIGLLNERSPRRRVRLASETEVEHLFPDCEQAAVPPCGVPYGVPVYVSDELFEAEAFVCAGGRGETWLRVDREAFERLARPHWLALPPNGSGDDPFRFP